MILFKPSRVEAFSKDNRPSINHKQLSIKCRSSSQQYRQYATLYQNMWANNKHTIQNHLTKQKKTLFNDSKTFFPHNHISMSYRMKLMSKRKKTIQDSKTLPLRSKIIELISQQKPILKDQLNSSSNFLLNRNVIKFKKIRFNNIDQQKEMFFNDNSVASRLKVTKFKLQQYNNFQIKEKKKRLEKLSKTCRNFHSKNKQNIVNIQFIQTENIAQTINRNQSKKSFIQQQLSPWDSFYKS